MDSFVQKTLTSIFFAALILLHFIAITAFAAQTDPSLVGRWSLGPNLPFFPVHAHTLPTGKIMMWPGDVGISGNNPWQWDPITGSLTQLALPGYDPFCSGHSFLADGRLFVAGGHIQNNVGLPTASTYNPFTDSWTIMPNMNAGRWYPTTATLANGDVLVVSGSINGTLGENRLPQVFQTATNTWRDLTNAQLALGLYPRMHLAPNGKVFVSGMSGTSRYLETAGTGSWSVVGNSSQGRDYGSSVMYDDGKVLIVGGGSSPPSKTTEVIDLNASTPTWRAVGSMAFARRQLNATILPDGKVLATGGTSGSGFNDSTGAVFAAEIWDPSTETWTTMASATIPRLYHSAVVLLPDGRLLSTGGNNYPQTEIYEPPYLFDSGARPTITSAPDSLTYGQMFFVETPDAASITQATWIRLSSVTHGFNMNQRFSRLSFSQTAGGLNVLAPSSANLSPPGYYMLFILNGNGGVPSVAKIIKIDSTAPVPALNSLSPVLANAGGAGFTLTVNGSNFVSGSEVRWNGAARPTTLVSGTQLTADIPASDIATAGTAQVSVFNLGGGTSNSLSFSIAPTICPTGQYLAEYFNNISLSGGPTFTACQSTINFNWGSGGPGNGLANDNFSVRWTGSHSFNAAPYTFTARADDGIRVWLDGSLIIDAWRDQPPTTYQTTRTLTAGEHLVKVEYYEKGGGAVAQVSWLSTAAPAGGLQFSSATYSVNENAGNATITITRTGGSAGAVGVTFSTGSATATANSDYNVTTQVVTFGNGDTANKTLSVPIIDDPTYEGNETINLTLSSPTGGATLGTINTAILTIVDNEASPDPAPNITTLSPASVIAGGAGFSLTVNGSNFVSGSEVRWNGAARTTTFASSTQVTAAIPASDTVTAGTAQVTVFNPAPGGGISNALTFTVGNPPTKCPTGQYLAEYFNNISLTGSPTFTACEAGISYNWGSGGPGNGLANDNFSVRWTGSYSFNAAPYTFTARGDDGIRVWLDGILIIDAWRDQPPTTYQAIRTLTAGDHLVKVEYYEKAGGAVAQLSWLETTNPVPVLNTISPGYTPPGGSDFTLTVNGSDFVNGSEVRWNGSPRPTTFVSSTRLTAAILATDIAIAGTAQVSVFNPAPGGGISNALTFTVGNPPASCPTGQYLAEYFNNISLTGSPTFTACEAGINYNWGSGGPGNGLANDNFSVRWTGNYSFNAAPYTFTARADDGIRVWLDGSLIIDAWRDQPPTTYQTTRTLTAGEHLVKVEYYEKGGGAVAQVSW